MRLQVRLVALVGALVLVPAATASAATQIATDTTTSSTGSAGQHATIVEPDRFGFEQFRRGRQVGQVWQVKRRQAKLAFAVDVQHRLAGDKQFQAGCRRQSACPSVSVWMAGFEPAWSGTRGRRMNPGSPTSRASFGSARPGQQKRPGVV